MIISLNTFAECFYDCCDCCDCDDSEEIDLTKQINSNEIHEKDKIVTEKILEHLKLDDWEKLKEIAGKIKEIKEGKKKLQEVLNITKDINWDSKYYPNTLIKWENYKCQYVTYFHIIPNNPYFLKFFLLCSELIKEQGTVLCEMCKLVKQCILRPRFDIKYKCTIKYIMIQFFYSKRYKDLKEEFKEAVTKEKRPFLTGDYNSSINYKFINGALSKDLDELFDLKGFELGSCFFARYIFELTSKKFSKLSNEEISTFLKIENNSLIGINITTLTPPHTYAIIRNENKYYIKDTYNKICKEITIDEILKLISEDKTIDRKISSVCYLKEYIQEDWEI